jgi:hypothetical protein
MCWLQQWGLGLDPGQARSHISTLPWLRAHAHAVPRSNTQRHGHEPSAVPRSNTQRTVVLTAWQVVARQVAAVAVGPGAGLSCSCAAQQWSSCSYMRAQVLVQSCSNTPSHTADSLARISCSGGCCSSGAWSWTLMPVLKCLQALT